MFVVDSTERSIILRPIEPYCHSDFMDMWNDIFESHIINYPKRMVKAANSIMTYFGHPFKMVNVFYNEDIEDFIWEMQPRNKGNSNATKPTK